MLAAAKTPPVSDRRRPEHRVAHRARLLVDLLEHEVLVAALLGHHRIPQRCAGSSLETARPPKSVNSTPAGVRTAISLVAEEDHVARVAEDRRARRRRRRYSSSPRPTTTGGPFRAATILSGSSARDHGEREYGPSACAGAPRGPRSPGRRPELLSSTRCAMISVSVSVSKMCPSACSCSLQIAGSSR